MMLNSESDPSCITGSSERFGVQGAFGFGACSGYRGAVSLGCRVPGVVCGPRGAVLVDF